MIGGDDGSDYAEHKNDPQPAAPTLNKRFLKNVIRDSVSFNNNERNMHASRAKLYTDDDDKRHDDTRHVDKREHRHHHHHHSHHKSHSKPSKKRAHDSTKHDGVAQPAGVVVDGVHLQAIHNGSDNDKDEPLKSQ